jgi:hypothetical protein
MTFRNAAGRILLSTKPAQSESLDTSNPQSAIEKAKSQIEVAESTLVENFVGTDLKVLQQSFVDIQTVVKNQFADHPYWRLLWSSDYFIHDLKAKLEKYDLHKAEHQVR